MKMIVGHSVSERFPGLARDLHACDGITTIHPSHGYHSFVEEMRLHSPDLVLTSDSMIAATVLSLPHLDDEMLPMHKRVVLTDDPSPTLLVVAAQAGFDDVVDVRQPIDLLVGDLRDVHEGRRSLRSHAIWKMLEYPIDLTKLELVMADDVDRQIVSLIAAGLSDREIAELVFLSCQTVRNRVSRLLDRCGARNRTQLALLYTRGQYERVVRHDHRHDTAHCRFDHRFGDGAFVEIG